MSMWVYSAILGVIAVVLFVVALVMRG